MGKLIVILLLVTSCRAPFMLQSPETSSAITGSEFYKKAAGLSKEEREAIALKEILAGNIPSFLKKMVRIHTSIIDSKGKTINAYYFVTPDYLSIGNNDDFARTPLTPTSAQTIADKYHCFLPTRKIVDDIYKQATIKLEPMPMFAFRDSTPTFYHHHLMIEGQRKGRSGLVAGIKKDVVISAKLLSDARKNRVAIYGWHKLDGKPIQPLYTGHVDWYVDYSHGVRLVHKTIWVNGRPMNYVDVMKHKIYKQLLCDEEACNVYRY